MNEQVYKELLDRVADIAAVAGVRGSIDPEAGTFGTRVGTGEKRSHAVFVRPSGEVGGGKPFITFFSIARTYPKTKLVSAISNKDLLGLLTKNEQLPFARYGIQERKDDYLLVASVDHLLETLDAEEFLAAATFVAMAADKCEAEKGEDKL